LTQASPTWDYAAETHVCYSKTFQGKVVRIITKLPRITSNKILHEQTEKPLIEKKESLASIEG